MEKKNFHTSPTLKHIFVAPRSVPQALSPVVVVVLNFAMNNMTLPALEKPRGLVLIGG